MATESVPQSWDSLHDTAAAVDFVRVLYAGVEEGWVTVFVEHPVTGANETRWVPVDDLGAVAAHVDELAPAHNVWLGVATRRKCLDGGRRGGKADCAQITAMWLDIDIEHDTAHKTGGTLPKDNKEAGEFARSLGLPMSGTVFSGHGIQPYWLLQEPLDAEDAFPLLARWQLTWERLARKHSYHLDNVSNIDRIMRLVGTVNRKDVPVLVEKRGTWSRRYGRDDLDEHLDELPPPTVRKDSGEPWPERDYFNEHHTCHDVLLRYGCTVLRRHHDGKVDYTRPNYPNPAKPGKSFTVYPDGHAAVWTEAIEGVESQTGHDAWGLHVVLNFGGDFATATESLKTELGPDWGEWAENVRNSAEEKAVDDYVNTVNAQVVITWDEPIPLRVQPNLPAFPDKYLPSWLGAFVRGVANSTQTPIDLCAFTALASLAVAAGGRVVVEIKGGWVEPTNLFTVSALPPGARKSAVVDIFARPFLTYQRDQKDPVRVRIVEQQALKRAAEGSLAQLLREIGKTDQEEIDEATKTENQQKIAARARLVDAVEMPIYPRLLADDATPEALASLMEAQNGRIGVLSAEGDVFDIMAGRYSGETNLGIYLKGHSGDTHQLDRKGREPEYIEHPALTLGLAVQPSVLQEIGHQRKFRGRGLLARFLYSVPEDLVGYRDSNAPPLDAGIALEYEAKMGALIKMLAAWDDPIRLSLTIEARDAVTSFADRVEKRLVRHGDLGSSDVLRMWASKLVGASVRIAGNLHVAEYVEGEPHRHPIELTTMQAAIKIAEDYCIGHARAAFDLMGQDEATVSAEAVLAWVVREGLEVFSKRDVHVVHRARFAKADEIDAPLALLERYGWIVPSIETARTGVGRKPSPKFKVNPAAQNTHITQNEDSVETVDSVQGE